MRFYSHSAHRAALKARGLAINPKWAGPEDKHLKRWDAPSAKSLADAAVLLTRGHEAAAEEREKLEAVKTEWPITVRTMSPEERPR